MILDCDQNVFTYILEQNVPLAIFILKKPIDFKRIYPRIGSSIWADFWDTSAIIYTRPYQDFMFSIDVGLSVGWERQSVTLPITDINKYLLNTTELGKCLYMYSAVGR